MKLKKVLTLLLSAAMVILLTGLFNVSNAASGDKWFNARSIYRDNYTYRADEKTVWRLYESTGSSNTPKNEGQTIFCLHRGVGLGSDFGSSTPERVNYNRYFNFKSSSMLNEIQKALPNLTEHDYKRLVWIFDHAYVAPKDSSEEADAHAYKAILLQNAGINDSVLAEAGTNYVAGSGQQLYEIDFTDEEIDDIIDVVQQMAVWNVVGDYVGNSLEIHRAEAGNLTYADFTEDSSILERLGDRYAARQFGGLLNSEIDKLYKYFVNESERQADSYDVHSSSQSITFGDTAANVSISGSNYIVGPFKLEKESNLDYTLNLKVTNDGNNLTNYTILNSNKQAVSSGTTIKSLVGQEFYLSIPDTTDLGEVNLKVTGTYYGTEITYWTVSGSENSQQPIVVLEKGNQDFEDSVKVVYEPTEEEYFDLSLRKYITKINDREIATNGKYIREPVVDVQPLVDKTDTTAAYRHNKYPILVEVGDIVTYTIRVYNEGKIDGYVREITDYLPAQLEYLPDDELNKQYGWEQVNNGRALKTNITSPDTTLTEEQEALYGSRENKTLLAKFNGTELDYIDVQVRCKVLDTGFRGEITNIAEITAFSDANGDAIVDRDSFKQNLNLPSDENLPAYRGKTSNKSDLSDSNYHYEGQEDDDDFEKIVLEEEPPPDVPEFDLSLRKFITAVNEEELKNIDGTYTREPIVDVSPLIQGSNTAIYNHPKTSVAVAREDIVTYTIRVYNEGEVDGYVKEITDHLPEQLEFIVNDELNVRYGWKVSEDGRTITTDITSPDTEYSATRDEIYAERTTEEDKILLKAFNGEKLDYIDVQVRCKVKKDIDITKKITNIADITDFADGNNQPVEDRDSEEDNVELPSDEDLPGYKDDEISSGKDYIPGQEDDDDFEKLIIEEIISKFDLALRKFITGVNDTQIDSRVPVFTITEDGKYVYEHTKDPVDVKTGDIVTYTIRVFNEGNMKGYAELVKDDIPEGLLFLPENQTNIDHRWKMYKEDGTETTNPEEVDYIETDYLSKAQEEETGRVTLLQAFNKDEMTQPDYHDVKVAFEVTEPNTSDRIIINHAQISEDADEDGNPVDDEDSEPDEWNEGEDDQDIEKIKVKYYDLALRKWVTESIVTYEGKTTVTKTGNTAEMDPEPPAKVEIRGSRLSKTTVKFRFKIRVTNEGEIAGHVGEISDYIPEGLKFVQADNPKWKEVEGKVVTDQLKDTLLEPGDSAEVEIVLTWINGQNNLGLKTNVAEISKDDGDDIDSTPDNNKDGEDDQDDAPVIISITTGTADTYKYIGLAAGVLAILSGGIVLIKKFVI
jgi:uncharacterized repeat protein (TIGR01451 family)